MRIAYYLPPEDVVLSGCDLWRVAMPMRTAERLDDENTYTEINDLKFKLDGNIAIGTNIDPEQFDLIHVGRPVITEFIDFAHVLKNSGVKFTMDFDDDFTDVHEENETRKNFSDDILESFREIVTLADGVTVTTPFLKKKFGHLNDNFEVIDNYIPESLVREGIRPKENILGWAGGVSVHPRDLEVVGNSVRDFLWKNRDWKFHHVGDGHVNEILKCPTTEFGTVEVLSYMAHIEQFKIGMAPLEVSDFNKSKSRLKALEMAALGVPWVASPLPEYKSVKSDYGCGILADSEQEWLDAFDKYNNNELFRLQQIQRGYEFARLNTYERHWTRWRDFFRRTLDN